MRDYAQYLVTPEVLDSFDLIGFDPRGVNHSTPVVCYTDPADQDELLYGTYDDPYGSEGWLEELTEREADWAAACAENTGPLLGHIDAGSVARDMDVIRAVLGDAKINYLGYSYGTYLGTMYAELFPEKVGRMVLDGAVDPTVSDLDAPRHPDGRIRRRAPRLHGVVPQRRVPVRRQRRRGARGCA